MEAVLHLKFEERVVRAMVLEVSSDSGYSEPPCTFVPAGRSIRRRRRSSTKLGHRLQADIFSRDEDEHKYAQVAVERKHVPRRLGLRSFNERRSTRSALERDSSLASGPLSVCLIITTGGL
jgi:hypothetical protein